MDLTNILFLVFIIFFFLIPAFKRRMVMVKRFQTIRAIEKERGTRLITLIHRQEALSLLGFPFFKFIDIEDSEKILRAIRFTPEERPIDLVVHTPGGLVLAAEQIARALVKHKSAVNVIVPHYAMSGGTLISLAADEVLMDDNAVLGPLDPQLGQLYPATSLLEVPKVKPLEKMKDETLVFLDVANKAVAQVEELIYDLLTTKGMVNKKAIDIAKTLTRGQWTHDYPLTVEKLKAIGITVTPKIPSNFYKLMDLYPQAPQSRPSVEYVPVPYPKKEEERKKAA